MNRAFAKSNRIGQVERLLLNSRTPLSQAEIARRCEVDRSTINRLIQDMVDEGIPVRIAEDKRIFIERTAYISKIHLKLHEAMAAFLACRLLARYSDKPNAHTVTTLEKIGASLLAVMPALGQHIGETTLALQKRLPKEAGDYQGSLERLTEAWAEGRKVRIWYRPLRARKAFQHTFAPYFLEPSAIGYSTYVIGLAEPPGKLRTRKLERIERIELTDEPFSVPTDFDPNALLAGAWGIWFDEDDQPTTVRLRFSGPQAIRRMGETIWHPSQQVELDAEGRLLWTAAIDEPQEMLPWIRGWGADCEVLAPAELREQVLGELRRQNQLYGILPSPKGEPELVAHTPAPGSDRWHPLIEHLTQVAELARSFAAPFGGGELAYQLGLWHDVGKANPAFQDYLRRCYIDPSQKGSGPDHKAAGALLATRHMEALALLVQGHHGGLESPSECRNWLKRCLEQHHIPDTPTSAIDQAIASIQLRLPHIEPATPLEDPAFLNNERSIEFFLRMLFSALVDADFLDTEQHMNYVKASRRVKLFQMDELLARFEDNQSRLMAQRKSGMVNEAREAMYQACLDAAKQPPGLFRLAMPTGGGKTRSGMAFALHHALQHGLTRIIVAVPFISITEQTAKEYREIFERNGDNTAIVLEHHSGTTQHTEAEDYHPKEYWRRLASENWDAPIIVTTTVQLFESMFANQPSHCRKLHRLAGSVIILDEAQSLPAHLLTPILDGLKQLSMNYGTTVVLSTATQPAFEQIKPFADLKPRDIVPNATRWFTTLKRVEYYWQLDRQLSWAEVADQMQAEPQALAVVNTKKDALDLLDALNDPEALHLSTLLCGAHRHNVIKTVHERLKAGAPCRLVSTQVIEAGVDLDFPLVLRAIGPLDRIIQAAGRCNREGKLLRGRVIIFDPTEGTMPAGPYATAYKIATQRTRELLSRDMFDPDNPADVQRYFELVFRNIDTDKKQIQALRKALRYAEVAAKFQMIDDANESVIITKYPVNESSKHTRIEADIKLLSEKPGQAREVLRRLQPFMVSIQHCDADRYKQQGWITELPIDGIGVWRAKYSDIRGLVPDDDRSLFSF